MNMVTSTMFSQLIGKTQTSVRSVAGKEKSLTASLSNIVDTLKQNKFDQAAKLIERLDEDEAIVEKLKQALENAKLAKELEEQRRQESEALTKIRSATDRAREAEKARAREKIEQLKCEIEMLMLMARINPKAVARRLAQLSKELSAAVKAYAGASSSSTSGMIMAPNSELLGADAMVSGQGAQGDGVSDIALSIPSSMITGSEEDGQKEEAQTAHMPDEELKAKFQEIADKQKEELGKDDEDQTFINEVRKVKQRIKALLEIVKRELESRDDDGAKDEIEATQKSLNNVDNTLSSIQSGLTIVPMAVNVSV